MILKTDIAITLGVKIFLQKLKETYYIHHNIKYHEVILLHK